MNRRYSCGKPDNGAGPTRDENYNITEHLTAPLILDIKGDIRGTHRSRNLCLNHHHKSQVHKSAMDKSCRPEQTGARQETTVDVLIVGAGPAGAALACFLSSHGVTGLMICAASSTADTPRAHITNMAALECLRDIRLDTECESLGTTGECMMHTRWCHSMAGEEFGRIYSWGMILEGRESTKQQALAGRLTSHRPS